MQVRCSKFLNTRSMASLCSQSGRVPDKRIRTRSDDGAVGLGLLATPIAAAPKTITTMLSHATSASAPLLRKCGPVVGTRHEFSHRGWATATLTGIRQRRRLPEQRHVRYGNKCYTGLQRSSGLPCMRVLCIRDYGGRGMAAVRWRQGCGSAQPHENPNARDRALRHQPRLLTCPSESGPSIAAVGRSGLTVRRTIHGLGGTRRIPWSGLRINNNGGAGLLGGLGDLVETVTTPYTAMAEYNGGYGGGYTSQRRRARARASPSVNPIIQCSTDRAPPRVP